MSNKQHITIRLHERPTVSAFSRGTKIIMLLHFVLGIIWIPLGLIVNVILEPPMDKPIPLDELFQPVSNNLAAFALHLPIALLEISAYLVFLAWLFRKLNPMIARADAVVSALFSAGTFAAGALISIFSLAGNESFMMFQINVVNWWQRH